MISLLGTLIIGLILGAIAKLIVPGKEPGGLSGNDGDRYRWFFSCLLPRKTAWLDFWKS